MPISVGSSSTATHLDRAALETVGEALAAQVERDVADLLVDADRLGDARLLHPLAAAEAGLVLGLADVGRDAELLADVGAGVHRDHRDAGGDRVADRIAERLGVRDRDHEAVRLRGHGGIDQLRHLDHVEGVGRLVLDGDAEVLGGLVDAVLDHRPERVGGLAVADHDEAHVLGDRRGGEAERGRHDGGLGKFAGHACYSLSSF